ncbi:membrane protein [Rhodopirellula maiorica SM1]|uniref:Membrane protein n=1 Tax=Rhodopirellula maiorica SM1 TaxID=1265738 RepID=M5RPG6_9BACT|nr:hypothetical protein [Rhodopirellula maiorica]EMI15839.1 membrane protein [Rhodopirellula maiorica SM1]
MTRGSQIHSFGRFLYTQNPFYLISCFLILYGLQTATVSAGDLISRSLSLSGGIAAYTLLMAVTCVAVIRICQVWQDARSIFLVVIISLVALSTSLDELAITQWNSATQILCVGFLFAVLISESVIRATRIRFPFAYRGSYYSLLLIFFASPIVLGYAVVHRHDELANWGAPLYSVLIAAGMLLLAPAMRKGRRRVRHNGTPWHWPYYPLSAFVILVVLAAIRTHAIWMSFGFRGSSVRFEPFLLLPIAFAILVLLAEIDAKRVLPRFAWGTMAAAPLMLFCGLSHHGKTYLPIQSDLQFVFGSASTVTLLALVLFYLYLAVRRVTYVEYGLIGSIVTMGVFAELPQTVYAAGVQNWMIVALGAIICSAVCLRVWRSDVGWFAVVVLSTLTIVMAGNAYDHTLAGLILAAVVAVMSMMLIGAVFESEFAMLLRHLAAGIIVIMVGSMVAWYLSGRADRRVLLGLITLSIVAVIYLQIVRRIGWLYIAAAPAFGLCLLLAWDGHQAGIFRKSNVPLQSGLTCFAIGLAITTMKTGVHRKLLRSTIQANALPRYKPGL